VLSHTEKENLCAAKRPKPKKEIDWWAKTKIVPWDRTPHPGPSHEQWIYWENPHAVVLRLACATMMKTKAELAELAGSCERDGQLDELLDRFDYSADFFHSMAKTIEGAKLRLLVGNAVSEKRPNKPPRRQKPHLTLVKVA
jgi:hypothetical protein